MNEKDIELELRKGTWWDSTSRPNKIENHRSFQRLLQVYNTPDGLLLIDEHGMVMPPSEVKQFAKQVQAAKTKDSEVLQHNIALLEETS